MLIFFGGNLFQFYCISFAFATAVIISTTATDDYSGLEAAVANQNSGLESAADITSNENVNCPNSCECYLDFVTCIRKQLIEIPLNIPISTKVLNLHGNLIQNISIDSFKYLSNLTVLNLSSNRIDFMPFDIFLYLPNLKHLELRDNRLTSVPVGLRQLITLEKLDLRLNSITEIKENDLIEILQIKIVDFGKNRINGWPIVNYNNFNETKLISLDLANNEIYTLQPNAFRMFRKLSHLRLARNRLDKIERTAFGDSLKTLDLSRNRIRKIDSLNFASQSKLETLNLNRNLIDALEPGAFHGVNNLQTLNLSSNRLQFISEGLFGLTNLSKLDLSLNEFRVVSEKMWSYVENLKWLSLSNNHITELTSYAFRPLNRLTNLSLARNQLKSVSKKSFIGLNLLEELDMSSNELAVCVEDGSVLQNTSLNTLKKLDFSANLIATIPANAFQGFKNLLSLDLSDNPIATIFSGAFDSLRLQELKISTSVLICDCRISWFPLWLQYTGLNSDHITAKCDHPSNLREMDVRKIENSKLLCVSQSPQSKITMQPLPLVIAQNGRDVRLHCKGYGAAPLQIHWKIFENDIDRILEEDLSLRIYVNHTIDVESHENEYAYSELLLRNVTVTDQAEYQCVVRNRHGSAYSVHSTLEIHDLPRFIALPPNDIAAISGDTVWIPCKATGIPEPIISYQKDMEHMFNAVRDKRVYVADKSDGLYLLRVNKYDEGVYSCIATNDAGQAIASTKLMVFENGFTNILTNTSVEESSPLILFCRGAVTVPFNIHWYLNGTRIMSNNNSLGTSFKGASSEMLVASNSNIYNSGYYRCELRVTEKELLLQAQSAFITVYPQNNSKANAMFVPATESYFTQPPRPTHNLRIETTTKIPPFLHIIPHKTNIPISTSTKQYFVPKLTAKTRGRINLSTTTTSSSPSSENRGFLYIISREFLKEYRSWSYPYQILLLFFIAFIVLILLFICYCGICLKLYRKFKKRRQHYRRDSRSNSFRTDFNVTEHLVLKRSIQYHEETSMSPSSTNSTSCTTYASLTPKSESMHTVETKRHANDKASLVKCI